MHYQRTTSLEKWPVFDFNRTYFIQIEPFCINKLNKFKNKRMSKIRLQENLKILLKEQGRPLSRVASLSQMNKSTLHGYMNGVVPKSLVSLVGLAKTLGVDPRDLLFGDLSFQEKRRGEKALIVGERFEVIIKPLTPGDEH